MSNETTDGAVREAVRKHYAEAVRSIGMDSGCCGPAAAPGTASAAPTKEAALSALGCGPAASTLDDEGPGAEFYPEQERRQLPRTAVEASFGCGNPTAVAELRPGETVLDLGSGGGIDVLLSARRVGPTGHAYGLDMTDEMLELARHNAAEAGAGNVTFLKGHIESIPLPEGTVDVVISNCVINLSPDKAAVFAEIFRVLRPGGRLGVADTVADDNLSQAERFELGNWEGCTAGALSKTEYEAALTTAGFTNIDVTFIRHEDNGVHPAIIKATRPA